MAVCEGEAHMTPVQCEDDQFGFDAVVVYGDSSHTLRRCTPIQRDGGPNVETGNSDTVPTSEPTHQLQDDEGGDDRGELNVTPHPVPETVPPQHFAHGDLTTDGGFPVAMAVGGMGNYRPRRLNSITLLEEEEKERNFKEKNKKVGRKGRKKSRRLCRSVIH